MNSRTKAFSRQSAGTKLDFLMPVISGALLVLGFSPLDLYPIAWIALVPLLASLWDKHIKRAFLYGMTTGLVYFTGTVYWVFNSVNVYGKIPFVPSAIIVIALCFYLAIYVGVFSIIFNRLIKASQLPALIITPVFWVTLEFLRSYALTGFPWSSLGYSQYKFLPMIQVADITGVYGISFLVAAVNGAVFDLIYLSKRQSRMPLFPFWPTIAGLIALSIIIVSCLSYGLWRLGVETKGSSVRVSVIQGNIEQDKKWDSNFQRAAIDAYKRLTLNAVNDSPNLIVWPETSVPFIFGYDKVLSSEITEFQQQIGTYLLFGSTQVKDVKGGKYLLSNSAVLLSPDGTVASIYDKIHLVPYGEYVPLRWLFPFIDKLVTAVGDFIPGKEYTVMETPYGSLGTPVCYEIIFPGLIRKFTFSGADIIVTVTNDAWFGRSSAPSQHFSMAVFRAVENRVPIARAANTGISGFIDAKGRIKNKSALFVEAVLTENLEVGSFKKSFYSKYGDLFSFLCIIISVILIANNLYRRQ